MSIQRTLSIIKPDAVAKNVIGQIVGRFEQAGLKVIAARLAQLSRADAERFYAVHKERPFFKDLVDFMISGPVFVQVLEGEDAILKNRDLMGATDPKKAAPGTIRADFADSIDANAVHGSDAPETAAVEVAFFFPEINIHSRWFSGNRFSVIAIPRSWKPSNESTCWGWMAPPCPNSSGSGAASRFAPVSCSAGCTSAAPIRSTP